MKFLRDRFPASYKIETKRGVEVVMVNNEACVAILVDVFKNQNAIHEFELDKFGREIVDTLNEYGYYPLSELIVWESVLSHNLAAIDFLGKLSKVIFQRFLFKKFFINNKKLA